MSELEVEVVDEVENHVPHELVRKAHRRLEGVVLADQDEVVVPPARAETELQVDKNPSGAVAVSLGSWALGELVEWPRLVSPRAVGTYAFVNPLVAVALAWATGDEPARARTVIAATLVVGATLLIRQPTTGERR